MINALSGLDRLKLSGDEGTGVMILRRALEEPMRQLAINAGEEGSVVVEAVRRRQIESNNRNMGYNVLSGQFVDMYEAKVTRSALEKASSIAGMILTTEALVTDTPEKEQAPAMPPGGMPEY